MRLALVLGELSSALPLPSVALFPVSCALSCIMGKKSCNAKRASPITNSRLNGRSMRCVIYESNDFDQRQPELVLDLRRANFLYIGPLYRPGGILRCEGPDLNRPSTTRNYAASSMI